MLFIFRQLRRLELRKRSGQYFLYAFGEIVLIVVGILIALQIQNWNQQRLDRTEERYLLEELVDNLNQEAERLEFGIERQGMQMESFKGILGFLESRSISQEEFEEDLGFYTGQFAFNPITSAYETMKNSGLGFSNRELKKLLVQYYDVEQPLFLATIDTLREFNRTHLTPIVLKYLPEGEFRVRRIPKDVDDPEFREAVLNTVRWKMRRTNGSIERSENIYTKNREILAFVEQELEDM
jgi:hypothetical protein